MVKFFGTTIRETMMAFSRVHAGVGTEPSQEGDKAKAMGRIVITILLIFLAAFLFKPGEGANNEFPVAIISTVMGYWLK